MSCSSEPSTTTLDRMIHFMVRYFLLGGGIDRANSTRAAPRPPQLFEDGDYARELFDHIFVQVHPLCRIARCRQVSR
jgi:hypothetical protein